MYFDTHTHLNSEKYENINSVIDCAIENGVKKMIVVGYDLESSRKAVEIASNFDNIYAAIGIHPSEVKNVNKDDFKELEGLCKKNNVVAIGEIGLDYHWDKENKGIQKYFFVKQLELAKKYELPIIIHSREAAEDTYNILREYAYCYSKGVMHCFSYSLEMARKFINLNLKIAFGGTLTFLNSKENKEVVKAIELKDILVETDCPYLTPHPYRGKVNEPKYIYLVADEIASLKNISKEEVCEKLYNNSCEVFGVKK